MKYLLLQFVLGIISIALLSCAAAVLSLGLGLLAIGFGVASYWAYEKFSKL
jgi:hypothetical protein